jgi:glycosyltransferase involved in cell wall biosynthesis
MKISVSMIALNEERYIARALSSCTFADEIVVVDGDSTDKTIEILQASDKVKIVHHPWQGHFGNQRQISLQHCTGDWVIRLDADEAFSRVFEERIRHLLENTHADVTAYGVRQCNLVGNECYYSHSADKFESIPRIWRNLSNVKWQDRIHESLTGFSGRILDWEAYVVHYGFLDKARFLKKARTYAQIPGSLVERAEDLVFRDYDFQPIPEQARVAPHVAPFSLNAGTPQKPKIAIVRGPHLDIDEIRSYAPLGEAFDIAVYTTCPLPFELSNTGIQVLRLPDDPHVATAMAGLEYALFDADVLYVPQIVWPYSYQAIRIKEKFGQKVIALQTDTVPFAHEKNEALKKLIQYNRPLVDMFVAASDCARDALLIEGVARQKIAVVPTGIDPKAGQAWDLGLLEALKSFYPAILST